MIGRALLYRETAERCGPDFEFVPHRQMGEKGFDFGCSHFLGMAFAVEQDKAANPIDVGLFGADAVMLETNFVENPIQQLQRLTLRNLRDNLVAY